jgi:hypothetical protein
MVEVTVDVALTRVAPVAVALPLLPSAEERMERALAVTEEETD